jgi:cytochrome c551/c552
MSSKSLTTRLLILSLLLFFGFSNSTQAADGKALFKEQCASCHNKDMRSDMTGPALGGMTQRWAAYPKEDLYAWIRNSQGLVAKGHPRAAELWGKWKPTIMTSFPNLKDDEIQAIVDYVEKVYTTPKTTAAPVGAAGGAQADQPKSSPVILWVILGILALLASVLWRIAGTLQYTSASLVGETAAPPRTLIQFLTSKGIIGFLIFALVVLGSYTTYRNTSGLGRQEGYMPDQPVKFSHITHAGVNKIDCQYCHDGARRSKHSVIPATNTCMNCHKAIKVGSTYGTAELTKIYASAGFNPATGTYIPNYDKMPADSIKALFKNWIMSNQATDVTAGQRAQVAEKQLAEIMPMANKPIEWVRVHNLPDHVYFNHAQHVTVGKIACQKCHGPVEEMKEVRQFTPLSMGWCVNCHRETEVQFKGNAYYETFKQYHEDMKSGKLEKVTVEDIGGVECQKCHY